MRRSGQIPQTLEVAGGARGRQQVFYCCQLDNTVRRAAYLPGFPASIYHGFVQNLPLSIWKTKTVAILARNRHELIATSRRKGIDSIIGEGLAAAKTGAQAVVDISNSPSFEDKAGLEFFKTSTSNSSCRGGGRRRSAPCRGFYRWY
ncbi:hypothetical protein [Paraburkholderia hospita]|uniref:hypothetical protein n=1 Tax=Paraburkholderia hospita TaxID=169430 RepID=UPI0039BE98D5